MLQWLPPPWWREGRGQRTCTGGSCCPGRTAPPAKAPPPAPPHPERGGRTPSGTKEALELPRPALRPPVPRMNGCAPRSGSANSWLAGITSAGGGNCFPVTGRPRAAPQPGPPARPAGLRGDPEAGEPSVPAGSLHSFGAHPDPLPAPGDRRRRPPRPAARGSAPRPLRPPGACHPARGGAGEGAHLPPALGAAARPCLRLCPRPPTRGEVPARPASPPQAPASPAGPHGDSAS